MEFNDHYEPVGKIKALMLACHEDNKKWWTDLETGLPKERNTGEMLLLIVSEICEAMEGHRKNLVDAHLPHRKAEEVELADALIRLLDYAEGRGLDLEGAFWQKMTYNRMREDHTDEHRRGVNGKRY